MTTKSVEKSQQNPYSNYASWELPLSVRLSIRSDVKKFLTLPETKRVIDIQIENWETFYKALEKCLTYKNSFIKLRNNNLILSGINNIGEDTKRLFVAKLCMELNNSEINLIENSVINDFFNRLYLLISAVIIAAYNQYKNAGEYGMVAHDGGTKMWSTRPPLR